MFLVSQSYLATDPNLPTSFTISGLPGGDVTSPADVAADGSVTLHFDLAAIAPGTYSVTADATNVAGNSAASNALDVIIAPPIAIPSVPVLGTSPT